MECERDHAVGSEREPVRPVVAADDLYGQAECLSDELLGLFVGFYAALPFTHAGLVGTRAQAAPARCGTDGRGKAVLRHAPGDSRIGERVTWDFLHSSIQSLTAHDR